MPFAIIATLCTAVFFGAALYISIVQHPASLSAGGQVPGRLFQSMYRRAAPMQATLAIVGSITALVACFSGYGWPWIIGGLLLFSVVPFTILKLKAVTDRLLEAGRDPESAETMQYLRAWGRLHWIRSILSGLALAVLVADLTGAL
jgi:hypothetical protein